MNSQGIESDFWAELAQIQAESIGWIPLEDGAYLHVSDETATELLVVGLASADMQTSNVLWVV
jgi:hypothetical protein